jgi:hypothetical protein
MGVRGACLPYLGHSSWAISGCSSTQTGSPRKASAQATGKCHSRTISWHLHEIKTGTRAVHWQAPVLTNGGASQTPAQEEMHSEVGGLAIEHTAGRSPNCIQIGWSQPSRMTLGTLILPLHTIGPDLHRVDLKGPTYLELSRGQSGPWWATLSARRLGVWSSDSNLPTLPGAGKSPTLRPGA